MKKVLVIADCDWWVFDKIYRGLKKNITKYEIDVVYTDKCRAFKTGDYAAVLFLPDHIPSLALQIPPEKLIWCIRYGADIQDKYPIYKDKKILAHAKIIAASNEQIAAVFRPLHGDVRVCPGGVDTDVFTFREHSVQDPMRGGWAGSKGRGESYRGLQIIEDACKLAGYRYRPQIAEKKRKNEAEMGEWYHNEIDVFIDMSANAGRQNGVLEAGSCGLPVICAPVGIAPQLFRNGENGYCCERNPVVIAKHLMELRSAGHYKKCAKQLRSDIMDRWSWKVQAKVFEKLFDDVCK
jgi:glycosyltransferase involved in cell wall biosynthesis